MDPKGEKWYEFHNLYNEILKNNARAKVVQTKKEEYQKAIEQTQDEHEKERLTAHLETLKNYKIGDDIPIYNKYFGPVLEHLPTNKTISGVIKRVRPGKGNENYVDDVETTIIDPSGLDEIAKQQRVLNPKVYTTGEDLGHTLIKHGGVPELNKKAKEIYNKALTFKIAELQEKYKADFQDYLQMNPGKTFRDFMNETGKGEELKSKYDKLAYLIGGTANNGSLNGPPNPVAVQYIPARPGEKLDNYTYSEDGKMRLSVDNDVLRSIYGATQDVPGQSEKIVKSELSTKLAEIELKKAQAAKSYSDAKANMIKANAVRAKVNAQIAKLKEGTEQDTYFSELWDRNPQEQKTLAATIDGSVVSHIPAASSLPVYTLKGDKVIELVPKGAQKVYDKVNEDGSPATGAKVTGYTGGSYVVKYVKPGTSKALSDKELMNAYNNSVAQYGEISFDEFIKGFLNSKKIDYVLEGENGTVDRKLALALQKKISNQSQKKGQGGIFDDSEDLTIDPNDITE